MKLSRNMVIVRTGTDLTLVNPVRLSEEGEEELKKLGDVTTLLRLGQFHGKDDAYYKSTFDAELLAVGPKSPYEVKIDKIVKESSELPIPNSDLFVFDFNNVSEGAIVICKDEGGILLTCDSLQSHKDDDVFVNWPMKKLMAKKGFKDSAVVVGPPWLKFVGDMEKAKSEFARLMKELNFTGLAGAHGKYLKDGAKEGAKGGIETAFQ